MRFFHRTTLLLSLATLLVGSAFGQTVDQRKGTISWVLGLRSPEGGFASMPATVEKKAPPGLRATSAALRALKYFGGTDPDRKANIRFVRQCQDSTTGGYGDSPGSKPDVTLTAVGIMAAAELKLPLDTQEKAIAWLQSGVVKTFEEVRIAVAGLEAYGVEPRLKADWQRIIEQDRNADGTWGKGTGQARATGSAVVALLRLGITPSNKETVLEVLRKGQRPDGGFGAENADSELESTYRIMRAFHMLNAKPANPAGLRQFVARCRNQDGGYGVAPGKPSAIGPTYYAGIILHWLDVP